MIDDNPLARPADRFPLGLAGRSVPISAELPTTVRPWGMDSAVIPVAVMLPDAVSSQIVVRLGAAVMPNLAMPGRPWSRHQVAACSTMAHTSPGPP